MISGRIATTEPIVAAAGTGASEQQASYVQPVPYIKLAPDDQKRHGDPAPDNARRPVAIGSAMTGMMAIFAAIIVGTMAMIAIAVTMMAGTIIGVARWSGIIIAKGTSSAKRMSDTSR